MRRLTRKQPGDLFGRRVVRGGDIGGVGAEGERNGGVPEGDEHTRLSASGQAQRPPVRVRPLLRHACHAPSLQPPPPTAPTVLRETRLQGSVSGWGAASEHGGMVARPRRATPVPRRIRHCGDSGRAAVATGPVQHRHHLSAGSVQRGDQRTERQVVLAMDLERLGRPTSPTPGWTTTSSSSQIPSRWPCATTAWPTAPSSTPWSRACTTSRARPPRRRTHIEGSTRIGLRPVVQPSVHPRVPADAPGRGQPWIAVIHRRAPCWTASRRR
jgi:hypothetical protein